MRRWVVMLALCAGAAGAAGPEKPKGDVAFAIPTNTEGREWLYFKDRPCKLPIRDARDMHEFVMRNWPRPHVGCWYNALQDGLVIAIVKDTSSGVVSTYDHQTYFFKLVRVEPDGSLTLLGESRAERDRASWARSDRSQ